MRDPVPNRFDMLREWFELSDKVGKEREEAISRIEDFLRRKDRSRMRRRASSG